MLLFGDGDSRDPARQTEDLGHDPILATELGLANIDRVLGYLVDATCREGEDYDLLRNMYGKVVGQRNRELGHVVNAVGGVNRRNFWFGDADAIYHPVSAEQQRDAVAFLLEHGFRTPDSLIDTEILRRLEPNGAVDRISGAQRSLLRQLVSEDRIERMAELAETADDPYRPVDLLGDLRQGIWAELETYPVRIDVYRRALQRSFVEVLTAAVRQETPATDLPALARAELDSLRESLQAALARNTDETTGAHMTDAVARIRQALDGREAAPVAGPALAGSSAAP